MHPSHRTHPSSTAPSLHPIYSLLKKQQEWFVRLEEEPHLPNLPSLFKPILHIVLLIWKNSAHYNTPVRYRIFEIYNYIII